MARFGEPNTLYQKALVEVIAGRAQMLGEAILFESPGGFTPEQQAERDQSYRALKRSYNAAFGQRQAEYGAAVFEAQARFRREGSVSFK